MGKENVLNVPYPGRPHLVMSTNGRYSTIKLLPPRNKEAVYFTHQSKISAETWHHRIMHLEPDKLQEQGIKLIKGKDCTVCSETKLTWTQPSLDESQKFIAEKPMDAFSMDLLVAPTEVGGHYLIMVDHFSKMIFGRVMLESINAENAIKTIKEIATHWPSIRPEKFSWQFHSYQCGSGHLSYSAYSSLCMPQEWSMSFRR